MGGRLLKVLLGKLRRVGGGTSEVGGRLLKVLLGKLQKEERLLGLVEEPVRWVEEPVLVGGMACGWRGRWQ